MGIEAPWERIKRKQQNTAPVGRRQKGPPFADGTDRPAQMVLNTNENPWLRQGTMIRLARFGRSPPGSNQTGVSVRDSCLINAKTEMYITMTNRMNISVDCVVPDMQQES